MLKKKLTAFLAVAMVAATVVGCGGGDDAKTDAPADNKTESEAPEADDKAEAPEADDSSDDNAEAPEADNSASSGGTIKVGVINNDPNESGYRTANDADLKATFSEANGYDATFAYGKTNDEQLKAAQQLIQDGIDYLLLSAADTSGWDGVLQDAQNAGTRVILFDRVIDADESLYEAAVVSDMEKEGADAVAWLESQGLDEYNILHIQGQMGTAAQVGRTKALVDKVAADEKWKLVGDKSQSAEWNAEKAQQIDEAAISAGDKFNVIYAENDDMAKGAVAALDKAGMTHGKDGDVIIMGFDCNKWALKEVLAGTWNFDGQCNPIQSPYIDEVIKTLEDGGSVAEKQIIVEEKIFDCDTITEQDVQDFGIGEE